MQNYFALEARAKVKQQQIHPFWREGIHFFAKGILVSTADVMQMTM